MSFAINIMFRKNIEAILNENVFLFKENGNIIRKYTIPDGYEIKSHNSNEIIDKDIIVLGLKKATPPQEIPEGYEDLHYTSSGSFSVKSIETFHYNTLCVNRHYKKELHYIDTSLLNENFFYEMAEKFKVKNAQIPDSFWISNQFRDIRESWSKIREAIEYANDFDVKNNSMLITQSELIAVLYNLVLLNTDDTIERKLGLDEHDFNKHVLVLPKYVRLENWSYPAKIENGQYCTMDYTSNGLNNNNFYNKSIELSNLNKYPYFPVPVIHKTLRK